MERIKQAAWRLAEKVFFSPKWSWVPPRVHRKALETFWGPSIRYYRKRWSSWLANPEHVAQAMKEGLKRVGGDRVIVLGPYVYTEAIQQTLEEQGTPYLFVDAAREAHPFEPVDPYAFGGVSRLFKAYRKQGASILDEAVHGVYLAPAKEGKVVFLTHEFTPFLIGPALAMLARVLVRGPLIYTTMEPRETQVERLARAIGARVERVETGLPVRTLIVHPPEDPVAKEILRAIERALLVSHRYGRRKASWADLVSRLSASLALLYSRLSKKERRRFWRYVSRLARV